MKINFAKTEPKEIARMLRSEYFDRACDMAFACALKFRLSLQAQENLGEAMDILDGEDAYKDEANLEAIGL